MEKVSTKSTDGFSLRDFRKKKIDIDQTLSFGQFRLAEYEFATFFNIPFCLDMIAILQGLDYLESYLLQKFTSGGRHLTLLVIDDNP